MISGILITAKHHMHVSQPWDLYTELKTNMSTFFRGIKKHRGVKSDVLLLN